MYAHAHSIRIYIYIYVYGYTVYVDLSLSIYIYTHIPRNITWSDSAPWHCAASATTSRAARTSWSPILVIVTVLMLY